MPFCLLVGGQGGYSVAQPASSDMARHRNPKKSPYFSNLLSLILLSASGSHVSCREVYLFVRARGSELGAIHNTPTWFARWFVGQLMERHKRAGWVALLSYRPEIPFFLLYLREGVNVYMNVLVALPETI